MGWRRVCRFIFLLACRTAREGVELLVSFLLGYVCEGIFRSNETRKRPGPAAYCNHPCNCVEAQGRLLIHLSHMFWSLSLSGRLDILRPSLEENQLHRRDLHRQQGQAR